MGVITGSVLLLLVSLTKANSPPILNQYLYFVCEDIPPDEYAFTINASDPEGLPLTFSMIQDVSDSFTVQASTGKVFVKSYLDREATNVVSFTVGISDGVNNMAFPINVLLNDTNDNAPRFDENYDRDVFENTTVGTVLFRVSATDNDIGFITYKIDEVIPTRGSGLFNISNNGNVVLSGSLNYTSLDKFYRLKINATDSGGQCHYNTTVYHSSVIIVAITVVDVADLDPVFIGLPYIKGVEENTELNTPVIRVTAVDQDTGIDDRIIYSIEDSTHDGLFRIDQNGIIFVNAPIDREKDGETVTLTVKAIESSLNIHGAIASTTAKVNINIIDVNDEIPKFYKCGDECVLETQFTGEVVEHSLAPVFFNMTVEDLDKNVRTELFLDGLDKDLFSVEPKDSVSKSIVHLRVIQQENLDYELKKQLKLQVIAVDKDNTDFRSTADVTLRIIDANDHRPKFPFDTYKLNVSEHAEVGTQVATITAEDPDTMDQGNITYNLLPDSILPYFDVEPRTGEIYVKSQEDLDREVRFLYTATLQARDSAGNPGTAQLEITLTDINDQKPVVNRDPYREFVKEGENIMVPIQATDADEQGTENSQLVYRIMPSEYSDNFTIDANTGVLRNKGELDREALDPHLNGIIELTVNVSDKGTHPLFDTTKVIISVEDVNDNGPEFESSSYNFTVKEGEKGAFVGSVFAEDLDQTKEFSRISFSIIDGSFGSFIIRSYPVEKGYMGNITVDPDIELDYESPRKHFSLSVEAADLDQRKATIMVEVKVLDVNDERPEFKPSGPVSVEENTKDPNVVGKFIGVDKDGTHSLVYELESIKCRCNGSMTPCNSFILEPTGEIKVNPESTIDYEQCDQAVVEAQVVDVNTEKGENNSATTGQIQIDIIDVNDNAPQFITSDIDSNVFVVVSESTTKGSPVARVTATDQDTGIYGQIQFKVNDAKFKDNSGVIQDMTALFVAETTQQKDIYSGTIKTTAGLDKTLKGKYLVTVVAADEDGNGLSSSTVLEIFTVDESFRIELRFKSPLESVQEDENDIKRLLSAATQTKVEIVEIREAKSEEKARVSGDTIMEAYFVNSNGTALSADAVENLLSQPEYVFELRKYGLSDIGNVSVEEEEVNPWEYIMLGMIGGLIIVLIVLTTSLVCTRRNYRRKLKAAKAMNSASLMASDNQTAGAVVPGTNKYTMEGANPVLNLNIDPAMMLDMDTGSSDTDKVSLNSLDYSDEMIMPEKDTKPIMQRIQEEEEDQLPEYIEPLGAALAHHGQKKGTNNRQEGVNNPAFNTTDL